MVTAKDKILVIDDQPSVRFGLRRLLEGEGYRVLEAETGAQALPIVTENASQLILLDLRLPDVNGLELLTRIKEIDDDVPVIILTATARSKLPFLPSRAAPRISSGSPSMPRAY